MDPSLEDEVLRLAVERGLLQATALDDLESDSTETTSRIDRVVEKGFLSERLVRELMKDARDTLPLGSDTTPTERDATPSGPIPWPFQSWDRYRFLAFLGEGGMGRVYKAFDPRLERPVALKFLRVEDPKQIERFRREALAQARVIHKHVCVVHEVGDVEGTPYIAMEYVEGESLRDVGQLMTLEQKLRLMKEVSEALHQAHRVGLIHRDVKPGNIMVVHTEDGGWQPSIVDFGLARQIAEGGVTLPGEVLGTPAYMSPEQARGDGDGIDRRTDVYSLGATLYAVLTGTRVFDGNLREVLQKISREVPRAPREIRPSIPRDVESITMKCLRKDPAERYDSARALAEELGRYLDGEPIEAHRTAILYRLRMKALKYKAEVATAAVALTLLGVAVGWGVHTSRRSAQIARLAQSFGQQVERVEAVARQSALTPLHDTRPERALIRTEMAAIEKQMQEVGKISAGPGHYALGRGYLLLESYEAAREHLEIAWSEGTTGPETAYVLGLTLGKLYQQALRVVDLIPGAKAQEAERERVELEYRDAADAALEYMRQGAELGAENAIHVEALLAYYEGRYEEALRGARTAAEGLPWLYEAKQLEGQTLIALAEQAAGRGDFETEAALFKEANRSFESAIQVGTSDAGLYLDRASLFWKRMLSEISNRGNDVEPFYREGLDSVERSLVALPENPAALNRLAALHRRMGEYQAGRGEDPTEHLRSALAAADRSLAAKPDQAEAFREAGTAFRRIAIYDQSRGRDPSVSLAQAMEAYERALELDPTSVGHARMGLVLKSVAQWQMGIGEDPRESLQRAIGTFDDGLALKSEYVPLLHNRGLCFSLLAQYEEEIGEDPTESLAKAIGSFNAALAENPDHVIVLHGLGSVYNQQAKLLARSGADPRPRVRDALEAYGRALELNSGSAYLAYFRDGCGVAYAIQAEYEREHGIDPEATLVLACSEFEQAITASPNHFYSHNNLGSVRLERAEHLMEMGLDPTIAIAEAQSSCRHAIDINPGLVQAHANLGNAYYVAAASDLAGGRDPAANLAQARAALEQAHDISPGSSLVLLGRVEVLQGRSRMAKGLDPAESFGRAEGLFTEVLQRDPGDHEACVELAELRRQQARWRQTEGRSAQAEIGDGLRRVEAALMDCPDSARARAIRGSLLRCRAEEGPEDEKAKVLIQARQDLRAALTENSHLERSYREELVRVDELLSAL